MKFIEKDGGGFDGEESAPLPLPQLKPALRAGLSAPHHSGTQVPQRLLMRLAPGETVPRAADARPRHRLPGAWAGG